MTREFFPPAAAAQAEGLPIAAATAIPTHGNFSWIAGRSSHNVMLLARQIIDTIISCARTPDVDAPAVV